MPAQSPKIGKKPEKMLRDLGQHLRDHRQTLGLSAVVTAEAAGMSRVTLYRIERGEASVTMGAYLSVVFALGLELDLSNPKILSKASKKLPEKIRLADYPQLKRLAWQLKGTKEIGIQEALDIYERNWKHIDLKSMDPKEQAFLNDLLESFGRKRLLV